MAVIDPVSSCGFGVTTPQGGNLVTVFWGTSATQVLGDMCLIFYFTNQTRVLFYFQEI